MQIVQVEVQISSKTGSNHRSFSDCFGESDCLMEEIQQNKMVEIVCSLSLKCE